MKYLFILCVAFIALIALLLYPATSNALMAFLFLGIIPGTNIQIPFWAMALLFVFGSIILLRWLLSQPLYIGGIEKQEKTARRLARKKITGSTRQRTSRKKRRKPTRRSA